jgi:hypothetical protein
MSTSIITPAAHELIDKLALNYAKKRERVKEIVDKLEDEVRAAHRRYRRELNEAIGTAEGAQAALRAEVEANPELFEKPRTWNLHGIKLGYGKGKGRTVWEDDAQLIKRIRSMFPAAVAETYIRTTEEPIVDALKELDAKALARLGVTVETTGDCVIVKAADSETDKLVKRLLKEGAREKEEA